MVDGDYEVELCEECQAPVSGSSAMAAYYFELPCEVICEESTGGNDAGPPTTKPLPNCYDGAFLQAVNGNEAVCGGDMDPIDILEMNDGNVKFKISNNWANAGISLDSLYMQYAPVSGDGETCMPYSSVAQGAFDTSVHTAKCVNGIADVKMYLADSNFASSNSGAVPGSCSSSPANSNCYFSYALPCKPELECTPAPTPAGDNLSTPAPVPRPAPNGSPSTTVDDDSHTSYPPGMVDVTKVVPDTYVEITVQQLIKGASGSPVQPGSGASISWISVEFLNYLQSGAQTCLKDETVSPYDYICDNGGCGPGSVKTFAVQCVGGVATIELAAHDGQITSYNEKPNGSVCSGWPKGDKVAFYTLTFDCSTAYNRRLDDLSLKESFTEDSAPGAHVPSENEEDIPYCVSEDFPCEGEGDDMVYVCHYSARKGYQTFCIPESDSDILRFYPNDYCGPCEGGYGGVWS